MFDRILVTLDVNDPEGSKPVAEAARKLATAHGSDLHALTVVPDPGFALVGSALSPDHAKDMQAAVTSALSALVSDVLGEGTTIHTAQGTIYDRILRTASEVGADCIVIGAHRPELRDYLIGPNAARVARHASQSVLVVR